MKIDMVFNYAGKSDKGKVRQINEDGIEGLIYNDTLFMIVIDAFGVADDNKQTIPLNRYIITEIIEYIKIFYKQNNKQNLEEILKQSIFLANRIVRKIKEIDSKNYKEDYGCSITMCGILPTKEMVFCHSGINRLYIIRQGNIFQGTTDDNQAYELLKQQKITQEEYINHSLRNVLTSGIGREEIIIPYTSSITVNENDFIILCTDGLYRILGDERIKNLIFNAGNLDLAAEWLIEGANKEGGYDNVSVILSLIQ